MQTFEEMTENIDPQRVSTELYLVEKIVDIRIRRQRIEYLVKYLLSRRRQLLGTTRQSHRRMPSFNPRIRKTGQ